MSHSIIIIHMTGPLMVNGVAKAEEKLSVEIPVPHDATPEQMGERVAFMLRTLEKVQSR